MGNESMYNLLDADIKLILVLADIQGWNIDIVLEVKI